jgi:hypothetical protein
MQRSLPETVAVAVDRFYSRITAAKSKTELTFTFDVFIVFSENAMYNEQHTL